MADTSAFNIAVQAEQLRNSQKLYFQLAKTAKQTKLPADFEAARKVLKVSKQQEVAFDDTIKQVLAESSHDLLDQVAHHIQRARAKLMDNFGLFGGGEMLNSVFDELSKGYRLASGGKHDAGSPPTD